MAKFYSDKDFGYKQLQKEIEEAKRKVVTIGVQAGAVHTDPETGKRADLVQIAAFHEFGTSQVPRRQFIAPVADGKRGQIADYVSQEFQKVSDGQKSTNNALSTIGLRVQAMIQDQITNGQYEALSAKTIKRKGSSKALIDTGQLRQSIRYEVKDNYHE